MDSTHDLRAMVRDVLREALAARGASAPVTAGTETVRVTCNADLQALVTRLTSPGVAEAVRAGTLRFSLAGAPVVAQAIPAAAPPTTSPTFDGVISERKLKGTPPGATVTLTRDAVLTPLAKDLGRRLGLNFERIG